jgi:hypothetical protein
MANISRHTARYRKAIPNAAARISNVILLFPLSISGKMIATLVWQDNGDSACETDELIDGALDRKPGV